jgi:hypothetical protein
MFKKKGLERIKALMLINSAISNEDKNNLAEYPEWEKTYKHKADEFAVAYNKFKIELIKLLTY